MTDQTAIITANPAIGLANLIGLPVDVMPHGHALPPGFHSLYFNVFGPMSDVGVDGHPRRELTPELSEFPRRMFAGAQMHFTQPLRIGDHARRSETVIDRTRKEGRTGALLFQRQSVTVSNETGVCVSERQTIVYRGEGQSAAAETHAVRTAHHVELFQPDEVTLFRFSALSGNSHRIHYDRPYATTVEGYPALVVHGPLIALRLLSFAARLGGVRNLLTFDFRAVSPLFLGIEARLCASEEGNILHLWAERSDGVLCMSAEAAFD